MFPNITKNVHDTRNTSMDIVSRVVRATIIQNDHTVNSKGISKTTSILTKEDIYRSLEKAYNHASKSK
ncbi:hypothetical protein [Arcobacter aquimarinus]|uniref:hypothetical protein n=1 Tax=Arcobacter aquimarinus TaxID=1315211 RepID=UPI003BB1A4F6